MKEFLIQNQYRILTILLLLSVFICPITADEAYYFSWGKQISFGYYDHPPLIGWITSLTNTSTLRLPFLFATLLFAMIAKEQVLGKLLFIRSSFIIGRCAPRYVNGLVGFLGHSLL